MDPDPDTDASPTTPDYHETYHVDPSPSPADDIRDTFLVMDSSVEQRSPSCCDSSQLYKRLVDLAQAASRGGAGGGAAAAALARGWS